MDGGGGVPPLTAGHHGRHRGDVSNVATPPGDSPQLWHKWRPVNISLSGRCQDGSRAANNASQVAPETPLANLGSTSAL